MKLFTNFIRKIKASPKLTFLFQFLGFYFLLMILYLYFMLANLSTTPKFVYTQF